MKNYNSRRNKIFYGGFVDIKYIKEKYLSYYLEINVICRLYFTMLQNRSDEF